jgi:hypothetical protein
MTGKIAIIDHRIPKLAKETLAKSFQLFELPNSLETYYSISSHPDIFFCKTNEGLIYAPNSDNKAITELKNKGITLIQGNSKIGSQYPDSAKYNATITQTHLIHNLIFTDKSIINSCNNLTQIKVEQGYTRCNLIEIDDNKFLTSDLGIYKTLQKSKVDSFFINPDKIILPGFKNGFFGGCCGFYENKLYVIGSLKSLSEEIELKKLLTKNKIELVELYKGPLIDGGSIIII